MNLLAGAAALAIVLAAIYGLQWLLQRRLGPQHGRRLHVAETIALDPRRRLHLIQCDSAYVLIETGGPQDMLVGWLPPPPAPQTLPVSP